MSSGKAQNPPGFAPCRVAKPKTRRVLLHVEWQSPKPGGFRSMSSGKAQNPAGFALHRLVDFKTCQGWRPGRATQRLSDLKKAFKRPTAVGTGANVQTFRKANRVGGQNYFSTDRWECFSWPLRDRGAHLKCDPRHVSPPTPAYNKETRVRVHYIYSNGRHPS